MKLKTTPEEIDEIKKGKWLEVYCAGNITAADVCEETGISIKQVARWRQTDISFEETYDRVDIYNHEIWPDDRPLKFGETGADMKKIESRGRKEEQKSLQVERNRIKAEDRAKLKKTWLETFNRLYFSIIETCRACGITRGGFESWKATDEDFRIAYFEAVEAKKDFIESQLMENIRKGDTQSIIFACKTRLKDRGYIEKQQIEHTGNFGVMLSPGTSNNANDWERNAKTQQLALVEKTNKEDAKRENGKPGNGKERHLGAARGKPNSLPQLSDLRSAVRRDQGKPKN